MTNKQHNKWFAFIPNFITTLNLICGTAGLFFAFNHHLDFAFLLMLCGALFDFTDGFVARALNVSGELGKQLDSLADVITFGVLPGAMVFSYQHSIIFSNIDSVNEINILQWIILFSALLIPAFSALRLAKFNIDSRQSTSFIGLPTPANALLFASVTYAANNYPNKLTSFLSNSYVLFFTTIIFSLLLISNLHLFSLKFKSFNIRKNIIRYIFLCIAIIFILIFRITGISLTIFAYIILSIIDQYMNKQTLTVK